MNRDGNRKNVSTTDLIRSCLLGTRSIARHGRASPELKAARAKLANLLRIPSRERDVKAVCEATAEHDAACRAMGLPGRPGTGGPLHPGGGGGGQISHEHAIAHKFDRAGFRVCKVCEGLRPYIGAPDWSAAEGQDMCDCAHEGN